jgi:hypothetical protein
MGLGKSKSKLLLNNKELEKDDKKIISIYLNQIPTCLIDIIWSYYTSIGTKLLYYKTDYITNSKLDCYDLILKQYLSPIQLPQKINVSRIYHLSWNNQSIILISPSIFFSDTLIIDKNAHGWIYIIKTEKWKKLPSGSIFEPIIKDNKLYITRDSSYYYLDLINGNKWLPSIKYSINEYTFNTIKLESSILCSFSISKNNKIITSDKLEFIIYPFVSSLIENRIYVISCESSAYFQINHKKDLGKWIRISCPKIVRNFGKILSYLNGILLIGYPLIDGSRSQYCEYWNSGTNTWTEICIDDISNIALII